MANLTVTQRQVRCWMQRMKGRAVRASPRTWLVLAPQGMAVFGVVQHPVMLALARKRLLALCGPQVVWNEARPSRAGTIADLASLDITG